MIVDQVKQDSFLPSNITSNINNFRPIQQQTRLIPSYPSPYPIQQQITTTVPSNYPRHFSASRRQAPLPTPISTNSSCSCSHRTPNTSTVITPSNGSTTSISPFILYPPNQTPNAIPTLTATTQQTVALAAAAASAGRFLF
jgi:hypothetical protein